MSTTAVTATAARFRNEQSMCASVRMRVSVRGRERNTVWALLGSGKLSNKKHILQAARELFLPCTFTSPQAVNFVVRIFLRLIVHGMQGLNLQILIWQNCSLQGVLRMVYPLERREGWVLGTCWLWRVVEDPPDLSFCLQWQILHECGSCGGDQPWGRIAKKERVAPRRISLPSFPFLMQFLAWYFKENFYGISHTNFTVFLHKPHWVSVV